MFLVGGLSQSSYIQGQIQGMFSSKLKVFTPPTPGAAICRGAGIYGLNPNIFAERVVRRSYGSLAVRQAIPRDPEHLRMKQPDGSELVQIVVPFVYKGQRIASGDWVTRDFNPIRMEDRVINIELFSTDKDFASTWYPSLPPSDKIGVIPVDVPDAPKLTDRTIVLEMNYSGPVIQVRGCPKNDRSRLREVRIDTQKNAVV
jgi:hypothetical protein